ncbi:dTMP kinase [Sphingomonas quercus]|uniref:Thymidylate kinase n=1 Tax=Sphingomonas quercus TaxID=2842451 RepID=A0ABS6BG84_9SPHN|nr:dTMP kinase [Sphingomonas quercus]
MSQGRFISLEGGEGVGKSTQLRLLAEALRARGHDVVTTREPGGSAGAEAIRALLFEGDGERWSPAAEALLFAAARADHVERVIRPAVAAGQWVVCDRFLDSSRAYQGDARGLGDADVLALHRIGSGGLLPDRTLVLSLPPGEAEARELARDGAADRFRRRGDAYHARVRAFFERIAVEEPERVRLIDATGEEGEVTARLLAALDAIA